MRSNKKSGFKSGGLVKSTANIVLIKLGDGGTVEQRLFIEKSCSIAGFFWICAFLI
jgi:hypothetical protein